MLAVVPRGYAPAERGQVNSAQLDLQLERMPLLIQLLFVILHHLWLQATSHELPPLLLNSLE
jgi:hypothetical protein